VEIRRFSRSAAYRRMCEHRSRTWGSVLTVAFFALLAILWMAILVPAMLRARASGPLSSAERFRRKMDLIAPPARAGRWVCVLDSPDRRARSTMLRAQRLAKSRRRRRRLLVFLLLCSIGTALYASLRGSAAWEIHIAVDVVLVLYLGFLVESNRRRAERSSKVRSINRKPTPARRARRAVGADEFEDYQAAAVGGRRY
jgi:hypothetical protein